MYPQQLWMPLQFRLRVLFIPKMINTKFESTRISAIAVALDTTAAETTAMKPSVARSSITAIAMMYPRIGRTVSSKPNYFPPND